MADPLREAAQAVVEAAKSLNTPIEWAADNRRTVIVNAIHLDRLMDAVDALHRAIQEASPAPAPAPALDGTEAARVVKASADAGLLTTYDNFDTLPDPDPAPPSTSMFAACPECLDKTVVRLESDWQARVNVDGQPIPVVGCGNPWHYADHLLGDAPAPAPALCSCDFRPGDCRDTHCRCHHHGYAAPAPAPAPALDREALWAAAIDVRASMSRSDFDRMVDRYPATAAEYSRG